MLISRLLRQPAVLTGAFAVAFAAVSLQGCREKSLAPHAQPEVFTTVFLADSTVAPGDTVIATVRVINQGDAPAHLRFYCSGYVGAAIESLDGKCLVRCIVDCEPAIPDSVDLVPGVTLERTFRLETIGQFTQQPLPQGEYSVIGGLLAGPSSRHPWVRARFVIQQQDLESAGSHSVPHPPSAAARCKVCMQRSHVSTGSLDHEEGGVRE